MSVYVQERDLGQAVPAMHSPQQSGQEMGLQLRFAAERGRLQDVRKMLAAGAPIIRDAVSGN